MLETDAQPSEEAARRIVTLLFSAFKMSKGSVDITEAIKPVVAELREREAQALERAAVAVCPWCDPAANHDPFTEVKAAEIKLLWDGYWHLCRFAEAEVGGSWRRCEASAIRALVQS